MLASGRHQQPDSSLLARLYTGAWLYVLRHTQQCGLHAHDDGAHRKHRRDNASGGVQRGYQRSYRRCDGSLERAFSSHYLAHVRRKPQSQRLAWRSGVCAL